MYHFEIKEEYLTTMFVHKKWSRFDGRESLTDDELIEVIKGRDQLSSSSNQDHPEFAKMRLFLERNGFIHLYHGVWNGDSVLQEFVLNGKYFAVGDRFVCSAAMKSALVHKPEYVVKGPQQIHRDFS